MVWAPYSAHVDLLLSGAEKGIVPMEREKLGYHVATLDSIPPDTQYVYALATAREPPDPASRFQPHGVHGPSQVVDFRRFECTDALWKGRPLEKSVFYELHVKTYTREGRYLWQGSRNYVELTPESLPAHILRVRRWIGTEGDFDYYLYLRV
jgi:maltooligosyltrehalose trehalohydrolase